MGQSVCTFCRWSIAKWTNLYTILLMMIMGQNPSNHKLLIYTNRASKQSGVQVRNTRLFYPGKNGNLLKTRYSTGLLVIFYICIQWCRDIIPKPVQPDMGSETKVELLPLGCIWLKKGQFFPLFNANRAFDYKKMLVLRKWLNDHDSQRFLRINVVSFMKYF